MKRIGLTLLLTLCLMGYGISHAEGITPFSRDITSARALLTIEKNVATCVGMISAKDPNNFLELTLILRKETNGRWIDVKKWTSNNKGRINLKRTYTISSGKYRVIARGSVKTPSGNVLEKISVNSSIVTL